MLSFDLSGASWEVVLLAVTVAVALALMQGPVRSAGWMRRASGYLDLADRLGRDGASHAERMAADALRKKAAELAVWRLRSRDAVGDGFLAAADMLATTICVSASLAVNAAIWAWNGSMGADAAFALFLLGTIVSAFIDGVRAIIRWLRERHLAADALDRGMRNADLDARVERMYREIMAMPTVEDLRERDGDGSAKQEHGDGDGDGEGDNDVDDKR